ncbi:hypothetical protein DPV79_06485 [Burkholderia reimsis]|uniref:Uncharacterized protein n=1 Tax=Burkholderia reimsis TaxID=2234132 RepID=A0A365R0W7_9BURK|nr:hypothetical protein DPV79_06485 [Burkholderia reimsis]
MNTHAVPAVPTVDTARRIRHDDVASPLAATPSISTCVKAYFAIRSRRPAETGYARSCVIMTHFNCQP